MRDFHYECQMVSKRRRSRFPGGIQQELVRHFVAGTSVRSAAELCGVNRNTAILYFHKLRELIAENLAADALDLMAGEIEVDKSCSGGLIYVSPKTNNTRPVAKTTM